MKPCRMAFVLKLLGFYLLSLWGSHGASAAPRSSQWLMGWSAQGRQIGI